MVVNAYKKDGFASARRRLNRRSLGNSCGTAAQGELGEQLEFLTDLIGSRQVAVAESCTAGLLSARLVSVPGSGDWFRGGIVAYQSPIKFELLGVAPGPVVNEQTAQEMAIGVTKLFDADIGMATTGVAGPSPQDDAPVGLVFIAHTIGGEVETHRYRFAGEPAQVRDRAVDAAVTQLVSALSNEHHRRHLHPL